MTNETIAPDGTAPQLKTFLVYAPDGKGEAALDRRYSVRPTHLKAIEPLLASKTIRELIIYVMSGFLSPLTNSCLSALLGFGGIMLDPASQPTEEDPRLRIVGSVMVIEAESIEKVRELVESDIYYKTGVVRAILLPGTVLETNCTP